jgi:NMD protein affecting ribosome stability and mRNA decay
MGLTAIRPPPNPLFARVRAAELIRLCPGCDTRLDETAAASGTFTVMGCRTCGLSVMLPRERRREPRG